MWERGRWHVCCIYSRGSLQYSQSEEEGLMSQSQSIREAIKCPDESTGHSLCLVLSFTLSPKNSFPLSSTIPPSHSLPSIFHTPPQISVNEDISHGSKHRPFLRSIWQQRGGGRAGLTFCSLFPRPPGCSGERCPRVIQSVCVFGERQRQKRQCHHCRRGRITLAPVRVRGHVISAI